MTSITVAVPTYGREQVLLDTVNALLTLQQRANEILVVDQTLQHKPATEERLDRWHRTGRVRWLRLGAPSIPHAMNVALQEAAHPIVLFVDDDVLPDLKLITAHTDCYGADERTWAVAGQVLQPGQLPTRGAGCRQSGFCADMDFPFNSTDRVSVNNVMAGNLSVRRDRAIEVGGFDENFQGVAHRFETEFARRLIRGGGKILFEPSASIRHLRIPSGGTRIHGNHLKSASPAHGVGDYYFAMRSGLSLQTLRYMLRRPFREVATKFHLRRPWYVPMKLFGEFRAFCWACRLVREGPRLIPGIKHETVPEKLPANDAKRRE